MKLKLNYKLVMLASVFATIGVPTFASCQTAPSDPQYVKQKEIYDSIASAKEKYKAGDINGAISIMEPEVSKYPDSNSANAWLGFLYLQSKNPTAAIPLLQKVVKQRPSDLEANSNLGSAYMESGDYQSAIDQLKKVQKLDPRFPQVAYNLGTAYLKMNDNQNAADSFEKDVKLDPNDAFGYNNLGIAYQGLGRFDDAGSAYGHAASLSPTEVAFQKNAGFAYVRAEEYDKAEPYLHASYFNNLSDTDSGMALANSEIQIKNYPEAIKVYDMLRDKMASDATYWYDLGVLRDQAGDAAGSEAAYRKCLGISPNNIDALNNLAIHLYKENSYSQAEVLFQKLLGLTPNSLETKKNLAAACLKSGDMQSAKNALLKVLSQDPTDISHMVQLGNTYNNLGEYENARNTYLTVLKTRPYNAEAHNGLGLYALHHSDLRAAFTQFNQAVQNDHKFVPAYVNLALTLEKLNHVPQAIRILEKAHSLSPSNLDVTKNLNRMKAVNS